VEETSLISRKALWTAVAPATALNARKVKSMEFEDLLAPVAGEFDVDEALESWRWLVPGDVRSLELTAFGDLFLIADDGKILFLDTIDGKVSEVAESVADWEKKVQVPELLDWWFMPAFLLQLQDAGSYLSQGECYTATIPTILSGPFSVANWRPTHWRIHFHSLGQIHEQVRDLAEGTKITKIHYTKI
jgi:hypothetical protein